MNVLILGGSKFVGLHLIEQIINILNIQNNITNNTNTNSNSNILKFNTIYILNRGKNYWNNKFYNIFKGSNTNKTNTNIFKHIIADRTNKEDLKKIIIKNIDMLKKLDFIIDFSCFELSDLLNLLNTGIKYHIYIFISSDSVYNVSQIALTRNDEFFSEENTDYISRKTEKYKIKEEQSILPNSKEDRKSMKRMDSYGYNKIQIENYILENYGNGSNSNNTNNNPVFIFLRLPDVIGEYDDSYRMWKYVEWLKYIKSNIKGDTSNNNTPSTILKPIIEFDKADIYRRFSLVYSKDIVKVILRLLKNMYIRGNISNSNTHNINITNIQNNNIIIYNVCCNEDITLKELVDYIANKINFKNYPYKIMDSFAETFYPSVTYGSISNNKIMNEIFNQDNNSIFNSVTNNFTPIYDCIDNSLDFIINQVEKYSKEYEGMKEELYED